MTMLETLKKVNLAEFMSACWDVKFECKGRQFVARSPFREEKNPSLYVRQEKDKHWVYYDHGNGSSGTIIDAVMEYEGYGDDVSRGILRAKQLSEEAGLLAREYVDPV